MIVSEIKNETVSLTVNSNFIILKLEKIKNKRISIQLSNITENTVRNIIISKQI